MDQRIGIYLLAALFTLGGCSKSKPTLAGGHPPSHWVEALNDPDPKNRKRAAHHLGNAGAVDGTIVPALTEALRDSDPTVRREAALALMKIGPAAKTAAEALTEAAKDKNTAVSEAATKAIESIQRGKK